MFVSFCLTETSSDLARQSYWQLFFLITGLPVQAPWHGWYQGSNTPDGQVTLYLFSSLLSWSTLVHWLSPGGTQQYLLSSLSSHQLQSSPPQLQCWPYHTQISPHLYWLVYSHWSGHQGLGLSCDVTSVMLRSMRRLSTTVQTTVFIVWVWALSLVSLVNCFLLTAHQAGWYQAPGRIQSSRPAPGPRRAGCGGADWLLYILLVDGGGGQILFLPLQLWRWGILNSDVKSSLYTRTEMEKIKIWKWKYLCR